MNKSEKLLFEAVKNMLSDENAMLGLSYHKSNDKNTSHNAQAQYENINDTMRLKLNNPKITMYESISGAFYKIHSYKHIDDPTFKNAFLKEMSGMAVPPIEQDLAIKYLEEIIKEFKYNTDTTRIDSMSIHKGFSQGQEASEGNADLDEIRKSTKNE